MALAIMVHKRREKQQDTRCTLVKGDCGGLQTTENQRWESVRSLYAFVTNMCRNSFISSSLATGNILSIKPSPSSTASQCSHKKCQTLSLEISRIDICFTYQDGSPPKLSCHTRMYESSPRVSEVVTRKELTLLRARVIHWLFLRRNA